MKSRLLDRLCAERDIYVWKKEISLCEKNANSVYKGHRNRSYNSILAFSVFLFIYFNFFGTASRVKLKDSLNAEINSKAMASDYIENIDGGKLKKDVQIDTSKLGKRNASWFLL